MYKCEKCGAIFADPHRLEERVGHSELGSLVSSYFPDVRVQDTCPVCGGDELEESTPCKTCADGLAFGGDYCTDCLQKVTEAVDTLQKQLGVPWQDAVDLVGEWYERNF